MFIIQTESNESNQLIMANIAGVIKQGLQSLTNGFRKLFEQYAVINYHNECFCCCIREYVNNAGGLFSFFF